MSSGQIQNTYVELTGCEAVLGVDSFHNIDRVKFHAEITDASMNGPTSDFDEWGFFYSKTQTKPDHTNGSTKLVVGGTPSVNWFDINSEAATHHGEKYWVNAYLYDSDHGIYIYQGDLGNEVAPDGVEYIVPNVDHSVPQTPELAFKIIINSQLETGWSGAPQPDPPVGFPITAAGVTYDTVALNKLTTPPYSAGTEQSAQVTDWGAEPNWTTEITDLSNNTTYKVVSWIEIKTHDATTHNGAALENVRIWQYEYHAGNSAPTKNQQQPELKSNYWTNPSPDEHVLIKFYPDADDTGDNERFVNARDPENPMEIYFGAQLEDMGHDAYEATKVGFFIGKSANPDHNTKTFEISYEDIGEPTIADEMPFNNDPANDDPIVVSGTEHFPIPGQQYYVNAFARDQFGIYYYDDDDGHQGQIAPSGVPFKIPKLVEHATELVKITDAKTTGNAEATFKATITIFLDYPGNNDAGGDMRGFMYGAETHANLMSGNYYPGHTASGFKSDPDDGVVRVEDTVPQDGNETADVDKSISNLSWGKNYYVRPFLYENMPGTDKETYFYATKETGNDAELCHWQPAQKFYIPIVADTPGGANATSSQFDIIAAPNNLDESDGNYDSQPPIYRKGYRWWVASGSESGGTDVWTGTTPSTTDDWAGVTISGLSAQTVYRWRAIAEVEQYVGAGAATVFRIQAATIEEIETLNPLTVSNTPASGDFIKVHEGDSTGMGNGKPFRNITVTGRLESIGGGSTLCKEVGFFVIDGENIPNDKPSHSSGGGAQGDGHDDSHGAVFTSLPVINDYPFPTNSNGGALYSPGTTYYVNFYAAVVPRETYEDYYYQGGQNNPPVGVDFQIPDVRNSTIFFTDENEMKLRGVVVKGDNTSYSGTTGGTGAPGPMTPIKYGFVYTHDGSPSSAVFPHKGSVDTDTYEGSQTDWNILVTPDETNHTFEIVINATNAPSPWPPHRGEEYFINAFIEDNNNIIYYPLSGYHKSFKIPEPRFLSEGTKGATSMILNGTLDDYAGWGGIPEIGNYGFIYHLVEASVESGTEVNYSTGDETAFSSNLPGLTGATKYFYRVFVYVKQLGSGSAEYKMFSEESPTPNFTTLPDFGDVSNDDPEFVTGYNIKLNGTVDNEGSGTQKATARGFFIHTAPNPGVSYVNGGPNTQVGDKYTAASFSETAWSRTILFNAFPPNKNSGAVAGATYWINAWVDDPTASDENGAGGLASGYRYDNDVSEPPTGVTFTLPNLEDHPSQNPPNTLDAWNNDPAAPTFDVKLFGKLAVQPKIGDPVASGAKKGFFYDTNIKPGFGSGAIKVEHATPDSGEYNKIVVGLQDETLYYFNAYAFDGQNYYYDGASTTYPAFSTIPDGDDFKLPAVTLDPITDVSGDAVQANASNNALTNFIIDRVGLYLEGVSQADEEPDDNDGPNNWSITKTPPLDTDDDKLGGNKLYSAQAFIRINGEEILSEPQTFWTETWPIITYKDISRNVTSLVGDKTGFILMETQVKSVATGSNAGISIARGSQLGFYIGAASGVRSGQAPLITKFTPLTADAPHDDIQSSEDTGTYLDRGKLYYSNTFVSQQCPPNDPGVSEPDNYQYYGFFHRPSYPQVGPPTLDASCTTLARANAGGTFPDGISFIIPDITNQDPEIIDSSTVKLKLYLDSSGHTVDVPGTDTLGFFFNHTDNPGADASCNNQAFSSQTVLDVSNVLIPWTNKISDTYHLDASGLKPGQNYYYTGYTAQLDTGSRGEGVDEDDYWYPPKYDQKDSSGVVKTFCIGDSSCNPIPSNKSLNETTLVGKTIGSPPNPYDNEHGFVYWFDGSNNYDNRKFLTPPTAPPGEWPPIELEGLKDSTRYYALPYFKQGTNYILGGLHDHGAPFPFVFENHPTIWYTDLSICDVALNDISGVEFGNDSGGAMTDDDSGSQTRYKIERIDASLNRNPPDNFKDEVWTEDCTREDCSGTVVELGLCWKVTDDPLGVGKATADPLILDLSFYKNLLYDGSFNGWLDVNQISGAPDVLKDASYNIYDASINDLSYNTMYSLRTYAKNEPIIDTTVVAGAEQDGGGYGYSKTITSNIAGWFITPLPKVIIEDPSAAQVPLENALSENPNVPSYAPKIFTKIGISGEILDNPDEASGNIIEYGFLMKMFTPSATSTSAVYGSFDNSNCDISTNLLGGSFNEDGLWDQEVGPYEFFQDFSLYPEGGVKDLSYNRQYYFGSYARNKSEHYLGLELVTDAISNGEEAYIEPSGVIRYKKQNDSSGVLITPWPAPFIRIASMNKPVNLTSVSLHTFVNVSLEIFNYDPTRWGGIAEFGVIWEKDKLLGDSNIVPNGDYGDPNAFTMQYMDGSGAWLGADGSGGWYRRGCSGEFLTDFGEPKDASRNPGWFWDEDNIKNQYENAGWIYDASFSSGGFPDGNENASCRWPQEEDTFLKLGVYKLGLQETTGLYPSVLVNHKPVTILGGEGSTQDPSSIPFDTGEIYWLRPYIITRNKGFWKPTDVNGNPRDDIGAHPDSSFNIFYGPAKSLAFDLQEPEVKTGHTDPDLKNWSNDGYVGTAGGKWPTMEDVGIDSVDMSGSIITNPIIGDTPRGRIIKYGFLWWDGGKTATEGQGALQWPGQQFGFGPKTAAGGSIPNLGFTLVNTYWPPDGSNNYCVPMKESTQIGLGWNGDIPGLEAGEGRTTSDLSGTNFDISANDAYAAGRDGGLDGEGYTAGGVSIASTHGYYWNTNNQASNSGWYTLPFPLANPPWNETGGVGPGGEDAIINSQTVVFNIKKTARLESREDTLFNSTVWYRAYAINRFFNKDSGKEQIGTSYGDVGRLELKKSVNYGVDMVNPVLASSNIGARSILVTGSLLGNRDSQGNPIVENYGFCWRKLIENHPKDDDGNDIPDVEREPSWYYDASGTPPGWATRYQSFPPPTVIDSSMVALGLRDDGKIWDDGGPIPLDEYNASNVEVSGFDASGEFPGETPNPLFNGFTQNPPSFKFGSRVWNFHYKIGSDGKELEAEGGVKDSDFVGFDASGGKLTSNTYYLIRAWVKGPIDPGTLEDDDGETASGIKYGPIWYINKEEQEDNKQRGWLALTRPLELCSLDDISKKKLTYKSVILKSKLLTNPDPSRLNKYGFVFMLDDASGNGLPTLEDNQYVLLNLPTDLNDLAAPPAKVMEKKISILPNSYYTVRAFADNLFESYISYDNSGNPEGSSTKEGGVVYSNSYTLLSDFCPPPESKIISATDASYVSVQLRGEILNNFNGLISKHGFIVGEETMPIINDGSSFIYDLGSNNNLGHFTHFAIGLKYNTTYFARSFAYHPASREDLRLQYGSHVLTFQTLNPDSPEIISTKEMPNARSHVSTTFTSEIKDTSGIELLSSYGFCWTTRIVPLSGKAEYTGSSEPPDNELKIGNADNYSEYTNIPDTFPFYFETILPNLQPLTTYYIRAYAKINPIGYGEVYKFTTLDEPCDCVPPTTKPIGALHPNKSSKMLRAEAIKRYGSAIIGTRGVTPNLL